MSKKQRAGVNEMRRAADRATATLQVLANPDRLLLLCHLAQGECCVSDLETALEIRQPTLSQQLGVLRAKGLVATHRKGKYVHYRIADEAVHALLDTLYSVYCRKPGMRRA